MPGNFGVFVDDRQPTAVIRNRADAAPPSASRMSQRLRSGSYTAETTLALNSMSRRRSILSVTNSR